MCENLVLVASTIGKFQCTKYLKPSFLNVCHKPGFGRAGHISDHRGGSRISEGGANRDIYIYGFKEFFCPLAWLYFTAPE